MRHTSEKGYLCSKVALAGAEPIRRRRVRVSGHPAASGADPIEARPGFAALLARIASNGVRTIVVESANRFARDLMAQEIGFARLQELGVKLIAADSPQALLDDTPTAKLIRQVLGAVAEFDKAMMIAKLKGRSRPQARDRRQGPGNTPPGGGFSAASLRDA